MKKNLKYILIMLLVLLVLGGALFLLLPKDDTTDGDDVTSETSSAAAENETLIDRTSDEVSALVVENSEGGFTLVPTDDGFTVEGYEDFPVSTSTARSTVDALATLQIAKNLGEREDLADFGLEGDTAVTVELQYTDGASDKLVLGNYPGETSGRYVSYNGSVYVGLGVSDLLYTDGFDYFLTTLYQINDLTEVTIDDEGNETTTTAEDVMKTFTLSGKNFAETIEIVNDESYNSRYLMTAPIMAESGVSAFTTVIEDLKALNSASSVVTAKPNDAALEQYGLKEPYAVVEFILNGEEHKVSVSAKQADGTRYLLLDDNDIVYTVYDSAVNSWAEASVMTLRQGYIRLADMTKVETLTVTQEGDMAYQFTTEREVDEDRTTDENTFYDLTIFNAGGEELDYDTYRDFYQDLLSIAVMSTDREEVSGTPAHAIEYRYFDGTAETVEFYTGAEGRYVVLLNGEFNGIVRKSDVDKLLGRLPEITATMAVKEA